MLSNHHLCLVSRGGRRWPEIGCDGGVCPCYRSLIFIVLFAYDKFSQQV